MIKRIYSYLLGRVVTVANLAIHGVSAIDYLRIEARKESAEFLSQYTRDVLFFSARQEIQRFALANLPHQDIVVFEFGIFRGRSSKFFVSEAKRRNKSIQIVGFDSFAGLGSNWSNPDHFDTFNQNGSVPRGLPKELEVHPGLVEDTLPNFLKSQPNRPALIHFDLDIYEPTFFALEALRDSKMLRQTYILFDEHHGFHGWKDGEYRALNEVIGPLGFKYVAFGPHQALVYVY